jgi:PAS domain S-box-containing protein
MRVSSLLKRFLTSGGDQSDYWTVVDQIGSAIRSSPDLRTTLNRTASSLGPVLEALRSSVVIFEDGSKEISSYCAQPVSSTLQERFELLDNEIAEKLSSEDHLIELTPESDPSLFELLQQGDAPANNLDIKSILVAPVVLDSEAIGAIIIYRQKNDLWSGKERQMVQAVASSLSLTVCHLRYLEKAKAASDREALTNRLLTAIRTTVGVDEILRVAVESVGSTLSVTRAVIYMDTDGDISKSAGRLAGSKLTARAQYRASVLVPSLLETGLDIEGSPILSQLLAGEMITIADTNESHPVVRAIGVRLGVRALALVPIGYNGHTVAALTLEQFDRPRTFAEEEIRLIRLVAEQTAVALYQADLYREAQESARREALISKISSAIHSSLDSNAVLQAIVKELGEALAVCRCRLALLPIPLPESIPITHEYTAECCREGRFAMPSVPVRDNPHLQAMLSSDEPLASDDVAADPRLLPCLDELKKTGVKSMLSTTIRLGGRPIGFFDLHHCERKHSWTRWEMEVVQSVAEQAAVAIRQAELYREARESATGAALVNQIVAAIRRSLDLEETLRVAVEELGRELGSNRTYFRRLVGDENVVVTEYVSGPELSVQHVAVSTDDYVSSYLMETRRTLIIDDVPSFISAHQELSAGVGIWQVEPRTMSQIVSPIFVNGQYWGALSISQTDHVRKWTASEIALVEVVTAQIEVAVSHSFLFEEAKRAAKREALISRLTHKINQSNQLDQIFPVVTRELGDHLGADRLVIVKYQDDSSEVSLECEYSDGKVYRPARAYSTALFDSFDSLAENGLIAIDDVEADPQFDSCLDSVFRPWQVRALMVAYLFYKGERSYAIVAVGKRPRAWTPEEMDIMRAAADQVFTALDRAELFEQVSRGKYEWEATFDALNDGIIIFDHRGLLRRINQAGAAFEGAEIRDLIGRKCCTLLQGIEGDQCRVAQVMKTGRPVTFELVPQRLSRPVLVTISPLSDWQKDGFCEAGSDAPAGQDFPDSGVIGAVCIVRDLSELRAAEAVAREQRGFLVKLIEHANDAIFALSPEGRFIWFNEELMKLSGYSREEIASSDYSRFIPAEDKKVAVERFARALAGQAQTFEMEGITKEGEARLLLVTYTPIYDEGRVTSVLSIARDITEERLASERAAQADKLRALGQLASGVAHNFNNILAAILGHSQLIRRITGDPRAIERLDIIERAAIDGAQTVKRIQGFGLQDQSDGDVQESVDINQLVQDSTTLTRARWCDDAQARSLYYEVEAEIQPVPVVQGTASELREVFVNIILNALDAMPDGGRLRITTEAVDSMVRVCFIDSGTGMSKEVRDHIFEPFFTTKGVSGMGLGLAVSYSIIERHGGRIEARSNTDRGTTFVITLPAAEGAREMVRRGGHRQVESASILVIDDDERVREAMVGMLRAAGHRTEQAATGRQGLKKMERCRYDLVFTDLAMPEMDGWAVASEIRRRWADVKIVLITGFPVSAETVEHHRGLVNKVILKPIQFDDISAALSQVLS